MMSEPTIQGRFLCFMGCEEMNKMKLPKNLGLILLGIWLIATGLMQVVSIPIPAMIMAVIAIAAGVLILFGK